MATFLELYGDKLDRELGTEDRAVRFTLARRKAYVNEGVKRFNEDTGCFVRRGNIALVDGQADYDLESTSVIADGDYIRVSKTSATLKRVGATSTDYLEGPELPYKSEEELNQTRPNWRAESAGVPQAWTLRSDGGAHYAQLVPPPDVPAGETWTLLWPYVATAPTLVDDADVPYTLSGNVRTTLVPYHDAILEYAAAQAEKLRKDYDASARHIKNYGAFLVRYAGQMTPPRGLQLRLMRDYRRGSRGQRPPDPYRD
ncbi:MAG: hypothetical protein ABL982_00045 [Vicinamibacterales bacterium]